MVTLWVVPPDVTEGPRRGRPLDPVVDELLRAAMVTVLAEHGWRGTTVERVAAQAGVARTAIYRRYQSLHGLMLMVLEHEWQIHPVADTGSLRGDLIMTARASQALWTDPARVDFLCAMTAARRESSDVDAALRARDATRLAALRPIVERAASRGELQAGLDHDLLLELVISVMLTRSAFAGNPPPADLPERVVDAVLVGFAA